MVKEYGYEYDAVIDEDLWRETAGKTTQNKLWDAFCLRSGRDALKAIAREFPPCVVWIPALSCDSMSLPFIKYGHKVQYYKLKDDYSIDLSSLLFGEEKTIFLYMDYFGRLSIKADDLIILREKYDVVFIEDRTHHLNWIERSQFVPDYSIVSLRKWAPIPDGGLLWGKITQPFESNVFFSSERLKAQNMRRLFLESGDERIKTKFRSIFSSLSEVINDDEPAGMSSYAYELSKSYHWSQTRAIRKSNAETLISILKTSPFITLLQENSGLSDLYVAFVTSNRDEVQRQLSSLGIFNTVIWPLTEEQRKTCPTAAFTEKSMLAAPCDQRYADDDMRFIGQEIVRTVANVNG